MKSESHLKPNEDQSLVDVSGQVSHYEMKLHIVIVAWRGNIVKAFVALTVLQ